MPQRSLLRPTDAPLLAALQVAPRLPWTQFAEVLGADASTLSRRWRTLQTAGEVWSTCQPAHSFTGRLSTIGSTAYIEVSCEAGYRDSVLRALSCIPDIWTIECTTGTRDLLLTVTTPTWSILDRLTREQLGRVDGIVRTVTTPIRRFHVQPGDWRLRALDPADERRLLDAAERQQSGRDTVGREPSRFERDIMASLAEDGRRTVSDIAQAIGRSVSGVSRALHQLERDRALALRIDFDQQRLGYIQLADLWVEAPQSQLTAIGAMLRRHRHSVRECATMVGRANLYVHLWVRSLDEVDAIEDELVRRFPSTRIRDRWLATRFAKRAGHLIDAAGRHIGYVAGPMSNAPAETTPGQTVTR